MANIFLSYASQDRPFAAAMAHLLAADGWTVWWDRDIRAGQQFARVIEAEVDNAQCIIVLWSHVSVLSDWVQAEAAEGMRRHILIPIVLGDVRLPLEFRRLQAISFSGDLSSLSEEYASLRPSITALLGEPSRNPTVPLSGPVAPRGKVSGPRNRSRAEGPPTTSPLATEPVPGPRSSKPKASPIPRNAPLENQPSGAHLRSAPQLPESASLQIREENWGGALLGAGGSLLKTVAAIAVALLGLIALMQVARLLGAG